MKLEDGIRLIDKLANENGEDFSDRQKTILRAAWNGKTYPEMKEDYPEIFENCNVGYIKTGLGYHLWKHVTSLFLAAKIITSEEKVSKENFKKFIESLESANLSNLVNLSSGEIFDNRYRIVRVDYQDNFRTTYIAEHLNYFNQLCVIQRINSTNINGNLRGCLKSTERQAKILRDLGDITTNVPKLFGWFEQGNYWHLIYEWIEGISLSQELANNPQKTEIEIKSLLREILEILIKLEKCQVIHRNIHPDYLIRRSKNNKLILVNFDNSKYSDKDKTRSLIDQYIVDSYAAPEFKSNPTYSSDLYSVGKICIQALTGATPNQCQINNFNWQETVEISDNLANILGKMVLEDSSQRYQSAQEILEIL